MSHEEFRLRSDLTKLERRVEALEVALREAIDIAVMGMHHDSPRANARASRLADLLALLSGSVQS